VISVTVRLFAGLQDGRFPTQETRVAQKSTVENIVQKLGIPDHEFGLALVNGSVATLTHVLEEGDTLSLYPLVGGG